MLLYIATGLFVIGCALLVAEMFIPGFGVCGISGIVAVVASAVMMIVGTPYGMLLVVLELLVIAGTIYGVYRYLRSRQTDNQLILNETLNVERPQIGSLEAFLGREGYAKTSLRPAGKVDFNGVVMDAYSDGEYITEKSKVKVINISDNRLTVRKLAAGN